MSDVRSTARCACWSALLALFCLWGTGNLRAQQMRVLAEPNESIQMPRGGYVCEGQLTHSPSGANLDLESIQCTGRIYNSTDYAAVQAKLNHEELVKLNGTMDRLARLSQEALVHQAQELNRDLKLTIEKRFQALPRDVQATAGVQQLKQSLLEYVDQRVTTPVGANPLVPASPRAPTGNPPPAPEP